jgi:hypothetical protein
MAEFISPISARAGVKGFFPPPLSNPLQKLVTPYREWPIRPG